MRWQEGVPPLADAVQPGSVTQDRRYQPHRAGPGHSRNCRACSLACCSRYRTCRMAVRGPSAKSAATWRSHNSATCSLSWSSPTIPHATPAARSCAASTTTPQLVKPTRLSEGSGNRQTGIEDAAQIHLGYKLLCHCARVPPGRPPHAAPCLTVRQGAIGASLATTCTSNRNPPAKTDAPPEARKAQGLVTERQPMRQILRQQAKTPDGRAKEHAGNSRREWQQPGSGRGCASRLRQATGSQRANKVPMLAQAAERVQAPWPGRRLPDGQAGSQAATRRSIGQSPWRIAFLHKIH